MTQQLLTRTGSDTITPPVGNPSGQSTVLVSVDERMALQRVLSTNLSLGTDSPVTVSLGTLSEVNYMTVRADGGKVRLRLTSSDGTSQSIPVDPSFSLRSDSVGITAIDVTRVTNTETEVFIVLGQKA